MFLSIFLSTHHPSNFDAYRVEHVRPIEETRKCLAILAVADEAETSGWRDVSCDAAHAAAHAGNGRSEFLNWMGGV
jgi:hypothetical protein